MKVKIISARSVNELETKTNEFLKTVTVKHVQLESNITYISYHIFYEDHQDSVRSRDMPPK